MVQCTRCNLQYIGETKRRLKDHFNEHRRAVDKPNIISKPTTVSEHFLTANHSASDMLLIPIQKLYCARDSIREFSRLYSRILAPNSRTSNNRIPLPLLIILLTILLSLSLIVIFPC